MDDETIKHDVRREIRRIREERGVSQTELSARSGIDRATLSQIETGRRAPTIGTLGRLAEGLGVEAGDLFPKVRPRLFDLPSEVDRGIATEEIDWSTASRATAAGAELQRILAEVENGETTAEQAAPAIMDAIGAMLKPGGTGGHAPAT